MVILFIIVIILNNIIYFCFCYSFPLFVFFELLIWFIFFRVLFILFTVSNSLVFSKDFTISSYNCGGLADHYDYIRSVDGFYQRG